MSFAGVELPQSGAPQESAPESSSAPESQVSASSDVEGTREAPKSQTPDIPDLDKLERFRFGGREMTRKELQDSFMRQSDYTRKTQEVAEARKYADNFRYDLQSVIANPQLLDKMREIYPAEYVKMAEEIIASRPSQSSQSGQQAVDAKPQLPIELQQALQDVQAWKSEMQEQKTQATLSQLNSLHEQMGQKYPYADPRLVDTMLVNAAEQGLKLDGNNVARAIENTYKMLHGEQDTRIKSAQKTKVEEQVKAGKQARDIGPGSSIPAAAPKKYKKFAEINADALSAFGGK